MKTSFLQIKAIFYRANIYIFIMFFFSCWFHFLYFHFYISIIGKA